MGYPANVLNVMIASPSDVGTEREIVTEEIHRWNNVNAYTRKLVLTTVKWETHSTPQLGAPPQEIINGQLLAAADILVGIFGTRIGTPTEKYLSGTVEEIKRHVAAGRTAKVYFSDTPVPPSEIDPDQYQALKAFREECKSLGLYAVYSDLDQFRTDFKQHLDIELNQPRYLMLSNLTPRASDPKESLSENASELLKAAASSKDGRIMYRQTIGSDFINVAGKTYTDGSVRSLATWKAALKELEDKKLVERSKPDLPIYEVTELGYRLADVLLKDEESHRPLSVRLEVTGRAEAQQLSLQASASVHATLLEYLTSSEACVAQQPVDFTGQGITLPIDQSRAIILNNSARPDRNPYDSAGPVKLRINLERGDQRRQLILPCMLQPKTVNSTQYITFDGSQEFNFPSDAK